MPKSKLRYPQPNLPPHLADERLKLLRIYIEFTRTLHLVAFPKKARRFGSDLETLIVLSCVFIGDAEGRPMTATKIASHAGLPRATVYRRLEQLMKIKRITRLARNYYIAPGAASPDHHGRLSKVLTSYLTE